MLDLTANSANVMSTGTFDFNLVERSSSISLIHGFGHQEFKIIVVLAMLPRQGHLDLELLGIYPGFWD